MGSETRRATELITIRLTPDDHARIVEAGEALGMGPSSFARVAACKAAGLPRPDVRRKPARQAVDVARVLGELGRIGNNVNQLARVANSRGDVPGARAVADLRCALEALTRAVMEARS